ncbi:MAG TPA: 1-aminocyclopropane-1-carboxylate deaminase/D-cysteine desulfhydrase [Flavobacteriia bacterium]|nr:1-aminocyclopropane-1-carboxylate deaminase/D-cysteine desulfhydrase [Flavobacteriia bacterium]
MQQFFNSKSVLNQSVQIEIAQAKEISLVIKREDVLHPEVSGNKFRKLKYNLIAAKEQRADTLLTFGGAFSNHIAATAAAGKEFGFNTIGIIRGDELTDKVAENPTLSFAQQCGMQFKFISRQQYRKKMNPDFLAQLKNEFGNFYMLPEGGTNDLAIKGCEEILTEEDENFDCICVAVGTGGTIAGLINSAKKHQKVLGFPALKGDFLRNEISLLASNKNWQLMTNYHFGGYGKINDKLITFINQFKEETNILLDPIYTGKMLFGILDLINKGYFKRGNKILAVHTGGLQGILGINKKLQQKGLPIIIE